MKISESITSNLLIEVDSLSYRVRNIKQCLRTATNPRLKERLVEENNIILARVNEINDIAKLLKKHSYEKINFKSLLFEKCKRTLFENKTEKNLFSL